VLRRPAIALMRVPLARRAILAALGVPGDPFGPAFGEDPYPLYRRLRARGPLYFARVGCWLVTGYAEAMAILRDPRFGHPDYRATLAAAPATPLERLRGAVILAMNPPEHTRVRRAVVDPLGLAAMERLRPRIQARVDRLLDRVESAGRMNVIDDLAYPLSMGTIAEVLGVPEEDGQRLQGPVQTVASLFLDFAPSPAAVERGQVAAAWLHEYFGRLLVERRRAPRPDLLTTLVQAERQGQLHAEEAVATSMLMLLAGYETTVAVIGNGMLALLRHGEQLRRLREDDELIRSAVEECIRYDSPIQSFGRIALEDVELGDKRIRRGQQVYVVIGAANRDPARFADPDRLDVSRPDNRHLGFGVGIHACPGQHMARIEAQVAIGTLARRFGRMELLTPPPVRLRAVHRRSLLTLPIAFSR
jgi:pimeloyl-[acyl-carrier protein] synthase